MVDVVICFEVMGLEVNTSEKGRSPSVRWSAEDKISYLLDCVVVLVCFERLKVLLNQFSRRLFKQIDQTTKELICSVFVDGFFVQVAGSFQTVDKTTQIISR